MGADVYDPMQIKVRTTNDGRAVIEQSKTSVVLSADQILTTINALHACYDYCAAWKVPPEQPDRAIVTDLP
jgi:hypothetical protein